MLSQCPKPPNPFLAYELTRTYGTNRFSTTARRAVSCPPAGSRTNKCCGAVQFLFRYLVYVWPRAAPCFPAGQSLGRMPSAPRQKWPQHMRSPCLLCLLEFGGFTARTARSDSSESRIANPRHGRNNTLIVSPGASTIRSNCSPPLSSGTSRIQCSSLLSTDLTRASASPNSFRE